MERSKGLFEPRTSAQSEFFSASYQARSSGCESDSRATGAILVPR